MKALLPKSLIASLALVLLVAPTSEAAVVVTLPTVSTAGSIVFTNDINFTVTTAGTVFTVAFDEWVSSDGSNTNYQLNTGAVSPSSLSYSINGGATASALFSQFRDNIAVTSGSITPNDGFISMSGPSLAVNDVFTIKAATYTLAANTLPVGFNPQANQTFTGNAFINASGGVRLSANTSVGAAPEPSRALLLLGGLGTLAFRRRRVA